MPFLMVLYTACLTQRSINKFLSTWIPLNPINLLVWKESSIIQLPRKVVEKWNLIHRANVKTWSSFRMFLIWRIFLSICKLWLFDIMTTLHSTLFRYSVGDIKYAYNDIHTLWHEANVSQKYHVCDLPNPFNDHLYVQLSYN